MIVCITGATAGIGRAAAYKFAEHGWDVILNGRRTDRLAAIEEEIKSVYGTRAFGLPFDVRDRAAVERAFKSLPHDWKSIDVLVNNAGLASGLSLIQAGEIDDWEKMIDTNVKGLLYVSHAVLPLMIANRKGHVINLGSIAGKEAYKKGNVYCSTKFAVDALSKAMRIDLLEQGIRVTAIHPGAAETEFSLVRFKGDAARAKKTYEGFDPLTAADVAEAIYFAASRPAHVCIGEIVMTPTAQANTAHIVKRTAD
jgi:NADP-dependent 3-hydroxy acid dehydrogenase YdfG